MATQTEEVKAGTELNVLIAERVMGWTRWDVTTGEDCPCEPGVTYFADWGEMGGVAVYTPPHLTGDVEYYFNPAEDIADAWRVVEKMRAEGWIVRVQEMPDGLPYLAGSGWRPEENQPIRKRVACWLYPSPELVAKMVGVYLSTVYEFAETAPRAISQAALTAKAMEAA